MSARSLIGALGRTARALAGARPLALLRCDAVGERVEVRGRASIRNGGRMEIGDGTVIWSRPVPVQLATGRDGSLLVRERVTIGYGSSIVAEGLVVIGAGSRIGAFATIFDGEDDAVTGWGRTSRPVVIGRDVRIGSKVTVLPGTSIGDGAEIGPGSVVSGVVPPRSVASGAPARIAREAAAEGARDVAERVGQLVARVFDRAAPPPLDLELERLSGWSSEGALRLLVALEEEFDTRIPVDGWLAVRSPADVVALVQRCTGAPAAGAAGTPTTAVS